MAPIGAAAKRRREAEGDSQGCLAAAFKKGSGGIAPRVAEGVSGMPPAKLRVVELPSGGATVASSASFASPASTLQPEQELGDAPPSCGAAAAGRGAGAPSPPPQELGKCPPSGCATLASAAAAPAAPSAMMPLAKELSETPPSCGTAAAGGGGGAAVPATPSQEQATQESLFNGLSDEESAEPMAVGVVGSSVVAEEKIVVGVGVEVVPAVIAKDLASRLGGCLAAGEQRFRCIAW